MKNEEPLDAFLFNEAIDEILKINFKHIKIRNLEFFFEKLVEKVVIITEKVNSEPTENVYVIDEISKIIASLDMIQVLYKKDIYH